MDAAEYAPQPTDTSRPSIGFPLGTALLLIVLFSLSGMISCYYHWDKLKELRHQAPDDGVDIERGPPSKSKETLMNSNKNYKGASLTVLMPGDVLPKFIALPCPSKPPRPPETIVRVEKRPKTTPVPLLAIPMYI